MLLKSPGRAQEENAKSLSDGADAPSAASAPEDKKEPKREYWRTSLLFQGWYGNGLGDRIAGNNGGGPLPPGRNYGLDGVSAFRVRRSEVALDVFPQGRDAPLPGEEGSALLPPGRFDLHTMFDLARAFDGSSHQQVLQDLTVGYQFNRHLRMEVGQQRTGLTEEGSRDDSRLLTVARAVMNEDLPAKVGLVGNARDFGLALRYRYPTVEGLVGIWDDNGATQNRQDNNSQKFIDGALFYTGISHLKAGLWGGMNVLGNTPSERRDRGGATFIWQHGPHYLEGEVAYGRDYAPGAPGPGLNGSISRGAYILYAHTISRRWQFVARYEHWDPAQQNGGPLVVVTETNLQIPRINHKLHEYTAGINYYLPRDSKLQFNLIRHDTEENGAGFFGKKRTLMLINFQTGLNAPTRPEALAGAYDRTGDVLTPDTNALRIGLLLSPSLGFAAGADIAFPKLHLLPGFRTRGAVDFLGEFNAPNFFAAPGTTYAATLDQVLSISGKYYAGFGLGMYFDGQLRPGGKFFVGAQVTRNVGVEFVTHLVGFERASVALQTRVPL
ncbi:MAG TPA: porin [Chthonomonadaceae bacterium]|nr:porin [Chthonomonadaceae bacterium]